MKSAKIQKSSYQIKNILQNFFGEYKNTLLIIFSFLILGIVTGIITASKYSDVLELINIPDSSLVKFISREKSVFSLFLTYFLMYSVIILFMVFLNNSIFFNIVTCILFFILGYRFGFTISALITLFSLAGALNCILIIVFDLVLFVILALFGCVAIKRYLIYRKYGCDTKPNSYFKFYIFLYIIFVLVLLIKCLLMPIINITIIVN